MLSNSRNDNLAFLIHLGCVWIMVCRWMKMKMFLREEKLNLFLWFPWNYTFPCASLHKIPKLNRLRDSFLDLQEVRSRLKRRIILMFSSNFKKKTNEEISEFIFHYMYRCMILLVRVCTWSVAGTFGPLWFSSRKSFKLLSWLTSVTTMSRGEQPNFTADVPFSCAKFNTFSSSIINTWWLAFLFHFLICSVVNGQLLMSLPPV